LGDEFWVTETSSARPARRTSGTSPDIDPQTLRGPDVRLAIERRTDRSSLARPAALPDHELERVRAALRAVANP
jgi:hypothetical protein